MRKAVSLRGPQDAGTMKSRSIQAAWMKWLDAHFLIAVVGAVPFWLLVGWGGAGKVYLPLGMPAWVAFVLWQPLLEEWVFRGLLQGELSRRLGAWAVAGISPANVVTTVCFVIAHLFHQPLAWALAVALPSLVLGYLRDRLDSTWPAAMLHSIYNAGFGVAAWFALRSGLG